MTVPLYAVSMYAVELTLQDRLTDEDTPKETHVHPVEHLRRIHEENLSISMCSFSNSV